MADKSKRAKLQLEKEDRISALPDSLIQHILSLLPSTKEAIQTSVLSKRWHNQWTHVPVLIFSKYCMSDERFSRFIDNTLLLHNSSKIEKFYIQSQDYQVGDDPHFNSKLRFAIRKGVEELVLEFRLSKRQFELPNFIFNYACLVKLYMFSCEIMPNQSVSWHRLKELRIDYSSLADEALERILIGSPLLESLQLTNCIYMPNISSRSLKRLVLMIDYDEIETQISCPKLENLTLLGCFNNIKIEFKDVSSLICATLDFNVGDHDKSSVEILQQLRHVEKLIFGSKFIKVLAKLRDNAGHRSPLLNNKSLTLDCPDFGKHPDGIAYALGISPFLQKLVIKKLVYKTAGHSTKYWDSKGKALGPFVQNLKTVHIVGLKRYECQVPLDFVDFLLKNTPLLEEFSMFKDG